MKTKKLLNDIYYEQKATNRHLQRLSNIALIGILAKISKAAKDNGDEAGKRLCKVGLVLIVIAEGLTLVSDILDYKAKRNREELLDFEEE